MVPMLRLAASGLKVAAGLTRSSIVMVGAPPVVMLMTQLERCLITLRNGANASGDWSGRPSLGLRACRCTMAAPASAAPMAASAISLAVIGRCGDIEGVWIEPVTAQVMMTLRPLAMGVSSMSFGHCAAGVGRHNAGDAKPHFTDEKAVGVISMLLTLARIGPSRSLSARAATHAGSAMKVAHFFSRSASDSQARK